MVRVSDMQSEIAFYWILLRAYRPANYSSSPTYPLEKIDSMAVAGGMK